MFSRRNVLKGAVASCAGGAVGGVLPPVSGAAQSAHGGTVSVHALFLELSRHLTGFDDLNEDLAVHFASYLAETEPDGWHALIDAGRSPGRPEDSAQFVAEALKSSGALARLARIATTLWYSGWTQPAPAVPEEVRATAYREALAWRTMELSPRGVPTGSLWQDPAN